MINNRDIDDKRFKELLDKWHEGDFTYAEEKELRALASADPFLKEAMEGYLSVPEADHGAAVDRLRNKIASKTAPRRRNMLWMVRLSAAAAVVALLLGVWWLLPERETRQTHIAEEQTNAAPALENESVAASEALPSPPMQTGSGSGSRIKLLEEPARKADDAVASAPSVAAPILKDASASGAGPVPDEEVALSEMPATKDEGLAAGSEKTRSYEAARNADPTLDRKPGDMARGRSWEDNAEQKTAEAPAKMTRTEDKAKKKSAGDDYEQNKAGLEAFLRQNARLTPAAKTAGLTGGRVRLEFSLDDNGKPVAFKTLESLGYGCDEAARQLVQQYPSFTVRNAKMTVTAIFMK